MNQPNNRSLIKALQDCAAACNRCATACLEEQEVKMLANCIRLDIDCAELCILTASFVARSSAHAKVTLQLCMDLCKACADECEKHASKHDHCRLCAEACRVCMELCQQEAVSVF